jgi:hypothetical protein
VAKLKARQADNDSESSYRDGVIIVPLLGAEMTTVSEMCRTTAMPLDIACPWDASSDMWLDGLILWKLRA